MVTTPSLPIKNLDYDILVADFKTFLRAQTEFSDYDLDASGLDTIIRLLSYNTFINNFTASMQTAEMEISTAQLRNSIVERAKSLNYTPRSISSATVLVDIIVTESGPSLPTTTIIEKGSTFSGQDTANTSLKFTATSSVSADENASNEWVFDDVNLQQGTFASVDFIKNDDDKHQRFILPHANIDTTLLEVYIQEGTDAAALTKYNVADDIVQVSTTDRVFYIQEYRDGKFEIVFGRGILGKAIGHQKIIRVIYFETEGELGNGLTSFTFDAATTVANPLNTAAFAITADNPSASGAALEDQEVIKFAAPKLIASNNRAVTTADYERIILNKYPDIKSVKVWGGEDNVPPVYGRTFISMNPVTGLFLSTAREEEILTFLKSDTAMPTFTPVFVEPSFLFVKLNSTIYINPTEAFKDPGEIIAAATAHFLAYSDTNLQKFGNDFEHSRVTTGIDALDASITNNILTVRISSRFPVQRNTPVFYSEVFNNTLVPGTLLSTPFIHNTNVVNFDDDGLGNIRIFKIQAATKIILDASAGTINYTTGTFDINQIVIQESLSDRLDLEISAVVAADNVFVDQNKILKIEEADISVAVKQ